MQLPVARFSPSARAGIAARKRQRRENSAHGDTIASANIMRRRCDFRAEQGMGKIRIPGQASPALADGESRATSLRSQIIEVRGTRVVENDDHSRMG